MHLCFHSTSPRDSQTLSLGSNDRVLYHFVQFGGHRSQSFSKNSASNIFSIFPIFGDLSEKIKNHVSAEICMLPVTGPGFVVTMSQMTDSSNGPNEESPNLIADEHSFGSWKQRKNDWSFVGALPGWWC